MPTDPPSEWYDIEDDDDMDYEPTTEGDEDDELPDREGDEGEDGQAILRGFLMSIQAESGLANPFD